MAELLVLIGISSTLVAKAIIYIKCRKAKDGCKNKRCRLRYWCEKYDYKKEVIDWLYEKS